MTHSGGEYSSAQLKRMYKGAAAFMGDSSFFADSYQERKRHDAQSIGFSMGMDFVSIFSGFFVSIYDSLTCLKDGEFYMSGILAFQAVISPLYNFVSFLATCLHSLIELVMGPPEKKAPGVDLTV